jgi:hypothetical protein
MSGRFGLLGHPHDDLVATEKLVEANPVVDIFRLYREGLLSPGASGMVDTGTGGCRPARHKAEISELEIDGQSLRIGWHSHLPLPTFICGACGRTCYRAHQVGGCGPAGYAIGSHTCRGIGTARFQVSTAFGI